MIAVSYTGIYLIVFLQAFANAAPPPKGSRRFLMDRMGQLYSACFFPLLLFTSVLHPVFLSNNQSLSFLPLMLTSVYCAWGIFWSWLGFNFLFFTDMQ